MAAHPHHDRMWLAHHGPAHAERCLHVHGVAVCRRCAVLYPMAVLFAVMVLVVDPPASWLVAAMWLLPVPMVLDWVGEHLGWVGYSPIRQVAVTAIGSPALGVALAIHALTPFSWPAVAPVVVWGGLCGAVALGAWWRSLPEEDAGWQERHERDEAERRERLDAILAEADARRPSP